MEAKMRTRDRIRQRLRRQGQWTAGKVNQASAVGADVTTGGRPHPRAGLPLLPSNSERVGEDNLLLLGPGHEMPAHAGTWPYFV